MPDDTRSLLKEIAAVNLAVQHKPFNSSTAQHQQFLKTYQEKTKILQQLHPYINLGKELTFFTENIH